MKKITSVLISVLILATAALGRTAGVPVLKDTGIAVTGPDAVAPGDIIEVAVSAPQTLEGISAVPQTAGLEFLHASSGLCADACLVLLPDMGMDSVVYTYRVHPEPGRQVRCVLAELTVTVGNSEFVCEPVAWCARVLEEQTAFTPASSPQLSPAVSGSEADPKIKIAEPVVAGGFTEIHICAPEDGSVFCGRLLLQGLSVLCTEGAAYQDEKLLLAAGTDAFLICAVTAKPGSDVQALMQNARATVGVYTCRVQAMNAENMKCIRGTGEQTLLLKTSVLDGASWTAQKMHERVFPQMKHVAVVSGDDCTKMPDAPIANGDRIFVTTPSGTYTLTGRIEMKGDICGSGRLDIAQLTALARRLNTDDTPASIRVAGDINGNDRLDIADLTSLADALLSHQSRTSCSAAARMSRNEGANVK